MLSNPLIFNVETQKTIHKTLAISVSHKMVKGMKFRYLKLNYIANNEDK